MADIGVNGVTLHYEQDGDGTPLLCIHGTGGSAALWDDAMPELTRRGRVLRYDRRGCGRSQRPDPYNTTSVQEQADDAAALLQAAEAAPAVVLGRSYGAEVAVDLVRRHPDLVHALVLLEPAILSLSPEADAWFETLAAEFRVTADTDGPAAAVEGLYRVLLGDSTWDGLPDDARTIFVDNYPAIAAELAGGWSELDESALAHVTQPALVVSSETSPEHFRTVDGVLAGMLPVARHEVIGGGHLVDPAAPVVLDFLDHVLRSPAAD